MSKTFFQFRSEFVSDYLNKHWKGDPRAEGERFKAMQMEARDEAQRIWEAENGKV